MQWLRWSVIVGLMIGLPAWAVLGDSDRLSAILNLSSSAASDDATNEIASLTDGDVTVRIPAEPESKSISSVYPEFDAPSATPKTSANGKPLRSAVYWPQAEKPTIDIRRVPAKEERALAVEDSANATAAANLPSVDALANELRSIGASRYRMEQSGQQYFFSCEFETRAAEDEPVVFRANSPDQAAAMQKVLLQARQWQSTRR